MDTDTTEIGEGTSSYEVFCTTWGKFIDFVVLRRDCKHGSRAEPRGGRAMLLIGSLTHGAEARRGGRAPSAQGSEQPLRPASH
jgi:hypothetical protein